MLKPHFSSIDWLSSKSHVLFNPKLPIFNQSKIEEMLFKCNHLPFHIWMATSGSSGCIKWAALSKKALLASAAAVNRHLKATSIDNWLNPLPLFHVGGLSIYARAYLSGANVILLNTNEHWNASLFVDQLHQCKCSLTSLVPTQVFDLVSLNLSPPASLRAVIVGGGALNESLYSEGIKRGWPLLPSYGLTEMCSQVATASLDSLKEPIFPKMMPLDHAELKKDENHYLHIKSSALFTGYFVNGEFLDPKKEGWFQTEDIVKEEITKGIITIGRQINFIKIGGESVDLTLLDAILEHVLLNLKINIKAILIPYADERLGHVIHLAVELEEKAGEKLIVQLVEQFKSLVLPFEKIRKVHYLTKIDTPSLKLIRSNVLQLLK